MDVNTLQAHPPVIFLKNEVRSFLRMIPGIFACKAFKCFILRLKSYHTGKEQRTVFFSSTLIYINGHLFEPNCCVQVLSLWAWQLHEKAKWGISKAIIAIKWVFHGKCMLLVNTCKSHIFDLFCCESVQFDHRWCQNGIFASSMINY